MLTRKQKFLLGLAVSFTVMTTSVLVFQSDSLIEVNSQELPYLNKYSESLISKKVPPMPSIERMYGSEYETITDLKTRSNTDVKESTTLPDGIELKLLLTKGTPEEKSRLTTVIYGPTSIDYNQLETLTDILDSHGIVVLYHEEQRSFDKNQWYEDVLSQRQHTQPIKVANIAGIGVAGNPEEGHGSKVIFHRENVQIQLISVAYDMIDLIRVAESL